MVLGLADRVSGLAMAMAMAMAESTRRTHSGRLDHHELPGERLKAQN